MALIWFLYHGKKLESVKADWLAFSLLTDDLEADGLSPPRHQPALLHKCKGERRERPAVGDLAEAERVEVPAVNLRELYEDLWNQNVDQGMESILPSAAATA